MGELLADAVTPLGVRARGGPHVEMALAARALDREITGERVGLHPE
jgi:hypothetical protein